MDAVALGPAPETVPPESWVRDAAVTRCELCRLDFGALRRKHHCRLCGHIFCAPCSDFWSPGPSGGAVERRCRPCYEALVRREKAAAAEKVGAAAAAAAARHEAQQGALARRQARLARVEAAVQDSGRQFAHGLPDIGRRAAAEKSYYLCRQRATDAQEVLLSLVTPRRRNLRMDEEMREFLLGLHHPFVMPVLDLAFVPEDGGAEGAGVGPPTASLGMFRSVAAWGSLRDVLHSSADPALPADAKYTAERRLGQSLDQERIALYGRQILEAMVFLQSVWVSGAGVTSANVLVLSDDWCLVSDWENDVLGLRSSSTKHDYLQSRDNPAVHAFGHVLYEMATGGAPLTSNTLPPEMQTTVPVPVLQVLDTIFNAPVGDRYEAVSAPLLLSMPIFSTVSLRARHARLLSVPAATTAAHRKLLTACGFVPTAAAVKEEKAARRHAKRFGKQAKAEQKLSREERRMARMTRRLRKQVRTSGTAAYVPPSVAGGAAPVPQSVHCVEVLSNQSLGLDLESILPEKGAGQRRERSDEGDVTVVRVEEGGQAEKLGVEVGMVLVGVAGVPVINAATGLPRTLGEVLAMVNAAREHCPTLQLEFAFPTPEAPGETVLLLDPTEPMGLELEDAGGDSAPWMVQCVSVVPGSQSASQAQMGLPCALTSVGGRSIADRSFDYVLTLLELAKGEAEEAGSKLELRFQPLQAAQWVAEPEDDPGSAGFDACSQHVFSNDEPLGIEFAHLDGGVRALRIPAGGQGDLLGVPEGRLLLTVNDTRVGGRSLEETVAIIKEMKAKKARLRLGFQTAAVADDPVLSALSDGIDAPRSQPTDRITSGFAFSASESLGLELEEAPQEEPWRVQVVACVRDGAAAGLGVEAGSLVAAVQGEAVQGMEFDTVVAKIAAARGGGDALWGIDGLVCLQLVSAQTALPAREAKADAELEEAAVPAWLRATGMAQHIEVFEENAIDEMELLEELGDAQLKEMGVSGPDRRLLLRAIGDWAAMGKEEAKRAAAKAAEAQILKLHRENAELRAKLSTADTAAQWAAAQAKEERAMAEVEAGGVRSVVAKLTDQGPLPVTKPRMDGSRRSDEIEAALAAQEVAKQSKSEKKKAKKKNKAKKRKPKPQPEPEPEPELEPNAEPSTDWLEDTLSEASESEPSAPAKERDTRKKSAAQLAKERLQTTSLFSGGSSESDVGSLSPSPDKGSPQGGFFGFAGSDDGDSGSETGSAAAAAEPAGQADAKKASVAYGLAGDDAGMFDLGSSSDEESIPSSFASYRPTGW